MKSIIISGYPKSGNTWVTRLTAELVGCPVVGFWRSTKNEIAREGEDRVSEYGCFKAHHQLHELELDDDTDEHRIIYVIRDPRDVAISGARYFQIDRWKRVADLFELLPRGQGLYRRTVYRIICPERFRIKQMVNAVLHGSEAVHYWCRIPWTTHYTPYWENGHLFVRYEDLLSSPEQECKRILDHLGLCRSEHQIGSAIINQSFERKKKEFRQRGDRRRAGFMRVGESGQWKKKLSKTHKEEFLTLLHKDLVRFSYE